MDRDACDGTMVDVKPTFSAEDYLRQAAARALQGHRGAVGFPPGSRLVAAAAGLVAVGAISAKNAQAIVDECLQVLGSNLGHVEVAVANTGGHPSHRHVTSAAVRLCPAEIRRTPGRLRLHYVVLGDQSVSIEATGFGKAENILGARVRIGDDTGATVDARFEGWASGDVCKGRFVGHGPLSVNTAYLRVGRSTVKVHPPRERQLSALVEPLNPPGQAERYLWLRVALGVAGQGAMRITDDFESSVEALLAGRFLRPDSPMLSELKAVCATFPLHPNQPRSPDLGEPWDSWQRRAYQRGGGPEGTVAIGAVTPPIDGVTVRFDGLVSRSDGFDVRIECSPGVGFGFGFGDDGDVAPVVRLLWLAKDDQDNYYFGAPASGWRWSPSGSQGTVEFRPPLNPGTKELHLLPTAVTQRGVVPIPDLSSSLL
jgi:hypothetical protein